MCMPVLVLPVGLDRKSSAKGKGRRTWSSFCANVLNSFLELDTADPSESP